jgi:hypothetical protein
LEDQTGIGAKWERVPKPLKKGGKTSIIPSIMVSKQVWDYVDAVLADGEASNVTALNVCRNESAIEDSA